MKLETAEAYALGAAGAVKGVYEEIIKPNPAIVAWGACLSVPAIYDVWAVKTGNETMSHAYHRGVEHPIMRFMCIGALGAAALHLGHGTRLKD